MKRLVLSLFVIGMVMNPLSGFSRQPSNFEGSKNVGVDKLMSPYKNGTALLVRNDSTFIADIAEDGSVSNLTYTKDFSRINPDGQVAYCDKTGTLYYTSSGKLFTAKQKKNGKWVEDKYVELLGTAIKRDKYKGSVLAYANWRYMPKDSIQIMNPTVNEDETEMYFASNMKDSKGLDIWKVEKDQDGEWGLPKRIDTRVNTNADENYPLIRKDGMLAFASNRKLGKLLPDSGKYDLYVVNLNSNKQPRLLADVQVEEDKVDQAKRLAAEKERMANEAAAALEEAIKLAEQQEKINSAESSALNDSNAIASAVPNDEKKQVEASDNGQTLTQSSEDKKVSDNEVALKNDKSDAVDNKQGEKSDDQAQKINAQKMEQIRNLDQSLESKPDSIVRVSNNVLATHEMRIFYFEYDKDIPNGTYKEDLEILLDFINAYPNDKFLLVGHTDERGSEDYNDVLSVKRAEWVLFNLLLRDVRLDRLQIRGDGERHPIVKNAKTEEDHQRNRRVEVIRLK